MRGECPAAKGMPVWAGAGLLCLTALAAGLVVKASLFAADYSEHEIKAAYLYKFSEYVEWPKEVFPDDNAPFTIGILGTDPFGSVIDDAVKEKKAQGRAIVVKRATVAKELAECQTVFFGSSEDSQMKESLSAFEGRGVLTVGESDEFMQQGGMIRFVLVENNVRFEINVDSAHKAGLKISSQLLKLAKTVHSEGGGKE